MKDNKLIITPDVFPHINLDTDNMEPITEEQRRQFKKSNAYRKYVKPVIDREKKQKRSKRIQWWKDNCIALLSLIFAFIAALPVIIQVFEYILSNIKL